MSHQARRAWLAAWLATLVTAPGCGTFPLAKAPDPGATTDPVRSEQRQEHGVDGALHGRTGAYLLLGSAAASRCDMPDRS